MKIKKEAEISMEYISIDIGNGYVKAVNLEGDTLHFPTVLKENRDKNILGEAKSNYKIDVNGKSYYIGNLAIAKRAVRRWQNTKAVNADTLLYIALCASILSKDDEINLCLGLPYSYYVEMKKGTQLIESLTNKTFETKYKQEKRTITINHVSVYPQGAGAYFNNLYDITGKARKGAEKYIKSLFIDLGYRTVDVVAFESVDNYFELIEENSFSLEELGTFRIVNYIVNNLNELEFNSDDVEYALRNNHGRIENMYDTIDLTELEATAYEELAEKIVTQINGRLSGQIQKYANVFLTGGGAEKLYPLLKEHYPNLKLQDDYIFCNAKGYLALENTK